MMSLAHINKRKITIVFYNFTERIRSILFPSPPTGTVGYGAFSLRSDLLIGADEEDYLANTNVSLALTDHLLQHNQRRFPYTEFHHEHNGYRATTLTDQW
jgi:hypothetical protein